MDDPCDGTPPARASRAPATAQGHPPLDGDGFEAWYVREFPRVRNALTLAVGDPGLAEEATAEAFARALVQWRRLEAGGRPTAWVYRVALNEVRSRFRRVLLERRHAARHREHHVPPPGEPDPQLWDAVASLAPRARAAIALRYVADMSEAEVADAMGITSGTVAATLSKARRRLAELLADHPVAPSSSAPVRPTSGS
jgi:RNA polymerase sigma-70 factor (ECF subfamily)